MDAITLYIDVLAKLWWVPAILATAWVGAWVVDKATR